VKKNICISIITHVHVFCNAEIQPTLLDDVYGSGECIDANDSSPVPEVLKTDQNEDGGTMEQGPVEYVQSLTSSIKKWKKKGNNLGNSKTQGLKMLYFWGKVTFLVTRYGARLEKCRPGSCLYLRI
jgi:hypothetical protein